MELSMLSKLKKQNISLLITILVFIGCAGSSSNSYKENSLFDVNSTKNSDLEIIMVDGSTYKLEKLSGEFVRNNGSSSVFLNNSSDEEGINFNKQAIKQTQNSFVVIIPEDNIFSNSFGILGIDPQHTKLANGQYEYKGNAEVFINDGNALYGLSGNGKILLNLNDSGDLVSGEISSLSGYKSFLDLSCRGCEVNDVLKITFPNGSFCNNNNICFDEIELQDSKLSLPLSSLYTLNAEGTFFGSDFSEFGFLFSLDDTKSGSIEMKGAITAQQQ